MRKLLQKYFRGPISRLADRYSSRPIKRRVNASLSRLYHRLLKNDGKKGPVLSVNDQHRFIILSDQHKGAKNGADDFAGCERNYLAALDHYDQEGFTYINLGDSEELWKNGILEVKKYNTASFEKEKQFLEGDRFIKIFGNHDLYWDNDPLAPLMLSGIYGQKVKIATGALLQLAIQDQLLNIFLTHGHQGDLQSDGNWFSKWFVSVIWAPLQSYLGLNPNTPANDDMLKTVHNRLMYEWSAGQQNLLLITGHTHQPVFLSLTHLERLYHALARAENDQNTAEVAELKAQIAQRYRKGDPVPDFKAYRPTYFNSGCCCFSDGDITGIEISEGCIRLIKWHHNGTASERMVLETTTLSSLISQL